MVIYLNEILRFLKDDLGIDDLINKNELYKSEKEKFKSIFKNVKKIRLEQKKIFNGSKKSKCNNIINFEDFSDVNNEEYYFLLTHDDFEE